jgi:predicted MFS family arabinose efflux permease
VHPLLKGLTGFTTTRIGILLLLFGLAAVAGTALGGVAVLQAMMARIPHR